MPAQRVAPVRLTGPLTLETVPGLHAQSRRWWVPGAQIEIDLSAVSDTDSAGLALLVTWLSEAAAAGSTIRLTSPPQSLHALIRINGLSGVFPDGLVG